MNLFQILNEHSPIMSKPDNDKQQPPSQPSFLHRVTTLVTTRTTTLHTLFLPPSLLKLLELSGDGRLWFPIALSLLYPLPFRSITLSLLVGLITDIAIIGSVKHLVRRPRPAHNHHPMGPTFAVDHWSFPSGHASRVCFISSLFDLSYSTILNGFDLDPVLLSRWIGGVWVWAIVTSISRVLLGRHYVFDVLVGSIIGVVNAYFVYHFVPF